MPDLASRFQVVARGRRVEIVDAKGFGASDYDVRYDEARDEYVVTLARGGRFEAAYRFVEHWIARHAKELDGIEEEAIPAGSVDLRVDPYAWLVQANAYPLLKTLISAVEDAVEFPREWPDPTGSGFRLQPHAHRDGLRRMAASFDRVLEELDARVLSPSSVEILNMLGIPPGFSR